MSTFILDPRTRLAIELALTESGDAKRRSEQELEGRRLGMSGAEIDVARRGRGFDLRTSCALALALACSSPNRTIRDALRDKAIAAGIPESVCREIEHLAEQYVAAPNGNLDEPSFEECFL